MYLASTESTIDSEGFKGGTRGAPIMPREAVSRTANVERNGGHKWVNTKDYVTVNLILILTNSNKIEQECGTFQYTPALVFNGHTTQIKHTTNIKKNRTLKKKKFEEKKSCK